MTVEKMTLEVRGMTCRNCVRMVERKLSETPGVRKATVDLAAGSAAVEYDPELATRDALADAVRALGYEVPA
jgi:copper ion binding protein